MRGRISRQSNLFVKINLEDLVPKDHPLRPIKRMADEALAAMSRTFTAAYAPAEKGGRPSIPPERLLKALILMSLYTVRSERALCERITFDMLFRWFLDMTPDEACFDHSDFTNFRERLDALDITRKFSDRVVMMAMEAGLVSQDHFSIDGSLIQSHASLKSLKHIEEIKRAAEERKPKRRNDDDDDDASTPPRPDSNAWVDFKGQKRSNSTHRSTTDPQARLYTKSSGQAALLHHSMHVLMENRHGLGVDIRVGAADGYAERKCCLKMLDRVKRKLGLEPTTLGADKGYDSADFLVALEQRGIEPHVACKSVKEIDVPRENDAGAWARWDNQQRAGDAGYVISQRKRKLDEEVFGWLKVVGGLKKVRLVGRRAIQHLAYIGLSTLNLIRLSRLLPT
ncbi:MAG: IS5 family transposase [Phycisphaerales bacterium]|nr:IS5 family transposase [Phycisphaerales bacterium]